MQTSQITAVSGHNFRSMTNALAAMSLIAVFRRRTLSIQGPPSAYYSLFEAVTLKKKRGIGFMNGFI